MTALPVTAASVETIDHAGTVLGRAFQHDPMFTTVLRDPVRRAAALPLIFRAMARQTVESGLVDTDEHGRATALWARPGTTQIGPLAMVRHGFVRAGIAGGLVDMLRLGRIQDAIASHHEQVCPEPHGYLFALGVDPEHQGHGIGSSMLARGCERLDELGLAGYLETNLPQNVRLYERHGFRTRRYLPQDGSKPFDTWLMVRPRS